MSLKVSTRIVITARDFTASESQAAGFILIWSQEAKKTWTVDL